MKVGIDVSGLFWKYKTGVQVLYYGLIEGLLSLEQTDDIDGYVFVDRSGQPGHELPFGGDRRFSLRSLVPLSFLPTYAPERFPSLMTRPVRYWNSTVREARRILANRTNSVERLHDGIDVLQVWNWDIRSSRRARHVITVPDVIPLLAPEFFPQQLIDETERSIRFARDEADRVIAISAFTKRDLVESFGLPAEKVSVVYPGRRTVFRRLPPGPVQQAVRQRFGIGSAPYMLSVGFLDPRKNVKGHLDAFRKVSGQPGFSDLHFVLVGPESDFTRTMLEGAGLLDIQDRIHFTGYVSDDDLVVLLNEAGVFVYCSHYEGFGLPVIEAMACGVPVVTSDSTSLKEIAGDAALLVDPADSDQIAAAIERILTDSALKDELVALGGLRAQRFTWEEWARGHVAAYRASCGSSRT